MEVEAVHHSFLENEMSVVHRRRFQSWLLVSMELIRLFEIPRDLRAATIQGADADTRGAGNCYTQLAQNVLPNDTEL